MRIEYDSNDCTLRFNYILLEEKVFQITIDGIRKCVKEALDKVKGEVNVVYLVGGFGGCQFVERKLEEALDDAIQIVCPQQADLAVTIGAVMWRKNPDIIQSRIADATYGLGACPAFDPSLHDENYRFTDEDGTERCNSVFKVFVMKGEEIGNELYTTSFIPAHQSHTTMSLSIYSTTDTSVQYMKDKEGKLTVQEIGELIIDIPNPDNLPRNERLVDIFMDFSGTEIQASAKYRITGEEVKTVCDFLSKQEKIS